MARASWHSYFMDIAKVVSTRATCDRKHVGAVIVNGRTIVSTGYNGAVSGAVHCEEAGHLLIGGHCRRTVHAEANAIAQAAKNGVSTQGCILYTTASPCFECSKLCAAAGLKQIVFDELYGELQVLQGIDIVYIGVLLKEEREV